MSGVREIAGDPDVTALPVLALVISALTAITGLALPFLAGRWERVGRRYEVGPATGTAAAETHDSRSQARADWDALTRGDDPPSTSGERGPTGASGRTCRTAGGVQGRRLILSGPQMP